MIRDPLYHMEYLTAQPHTKYLTPSLAAVGGWQLHIVMLAASLRAAVERQPRRGRSRAGRPALLIPIARGREQTSRSTRMRAAIRELLTD